MKRLRLLTERAAAKLNRSFDRARKTARASNIGGRYIDVSRLRDVQRLALSLSLFEEAALLFGLHSPSGLAVLSCAALDVDPGDPGLGEHVDYPHEMFPRTEHLSAQVVLSLDGTDAARAPLWVGTRENLVTLEPGEAAFFGGNTKHGVHPNASDRRRTTLLWSYGPIWIRPMTAAVWGWDHRDARRWDRREGRS